MEKCQAKIGFFSLRDCGENAVKHCATCNRAMCSMHLSPASGHMHCLDCEARAAEAKGVKGTPPADRPLTDPGFPYRYRTRYYGSSGYAPIYFGTFYDSYYDDYDLRSFDSDMASRGPAMAKERERGTGIGDS